MDYIDVEIFLYDNVHFIFIPKISSVDLKLLFEKMYWETEKQNNLVI